MFIVFVILTMQGCNPFNNHLSEVQFASGAPPYPDCTNDFFGSCVIKSATKAGVDSNLLSSNIVSGVTIFGVSGTAVIASPCTNDNGGNCRITQANKTALEPNLIASNIMNGVTVFGVTGTYQGPTPCTNDNAGSCRITQANKTLLEPNLVAGNIQNGVTVFGVTGTYQGPSPCTNDNAGSCRITQANKTILESNLIASNIKSGITIFGVLGSYTGAGVAMASNQHRNLATTQVDQLTESVTNAGIDYTSADPGYRAVPKITKDDDGYTGGSVTYVDRSTWASTTCGTTQATLNARIADCATVFGANATWDGSIKGNAGQGQWKLVSRTGGISSGRGREVWQDQRTMLLWSSAVSSSLNWCKASGSNNIAGNPTAENDAQNYCNNATYQNTSGLAISACFEDGNVNFTTTDAGIHNAGKAGLMRSSTPAVKWRLPSVYDQQQANINGIRFVFPDMGTNSINYEWSASVYSGYRYYAWMFVPGDGSFVYGSRNSSSAVRCVGR